MCGLGINSLFLQYVSGTDAQVAALHAVRLLNRAGPVWMAGAEAGGVTEAGRTNSRPGQGPPAT